MVILPTWSRRLLLAQWRAHPTRFWISLLSIAIGVAMGYAVYLINHTALAEFAQAARTLSGQADLQIRGPQSGFDQDLYPRLAALPEVAAASPVVEIRTTASGTPRRQGPDQPLTLLGLDVFRAMQVTPELIGQTAADEEASRLAHLDPGSLFLSPAALAALALAPGDAVTLRGSEGPATFTVAGTLPAADTTQRLAVVDIGAAQWRFGQLGRLQRIDLRLRPGTDPGAFSRRLAALLPPGINAVAPQEHRQVTADLSRAYRVNLNVLALVALFTGAFLVFSGQILAMESRRTQFALLRALGVTRRELLHVLAIESLLLGLLGALLGIALGLGIAVFALRYLGADLGGGYFSTQATGIAFSPWPALAFLALGAAAALLGGYFPAREAARAQPAQALKAGGMAPIMRVSHAAWTGPAWILAGVACTLIPPIGGLPIPAYLAIALILTGAILWMPWATHHVLQQLPKTRRSTWYLAVAQLAASPTRASVALSGVLVSFALMAAMVIMVSSFRVSFNHWLDTVLPAQLYVRAAAAQATGTLMPQDQAAILNTPGVARVEFMQTDQITLDPRLPPAALIIRPIDPHAPGARLALTASIAPAARSALPPVWISEATASLYTLHLGQTMRIPIGGAWHNVQVAGIWRDYARQFGAIVLSTDDAQRLGIPVQPAEAALWLKPHAQAGRVLQDLRAHFATRGFLFHSTAEIRAASLRIFDRSFAVTYLLEAVAILVGLFGVGVCFGVQAAARAREFGVLRHIGVTRRQIAAMLAWEGSLLGALGVAAGLLTGAGIAWILIAVVNPQSFHWTMTLSWPAGSLITAGVAVIAAAALTALVTGWRAMGTSAVQAVREDW